MIIIKPDVGILKILNDKKMFISVLHENIYISEALGPIMGVYSLALIFSLTVRAPRDVAVLAVLDLRSPRSSFKSSRTS